MFCCMQWYAPFLRHQPHAPLAVCLSSHLHQPHPCTSASDLVLSHPIQRTGHILTIRIVSSWRHLAIRLQRMCTFNSVTDISLPLQETRTAAELALQLRAFDTYIDWDALRRPAAAEVDILFGGAEILQRRQAGSAPPPTAVPTAESGVTCCAISSGQWSMLQLEAWPGLRQQQSWGKDP